MRDVEPTKTKAVGVRMTTQEHAKISDRAYAANITMTEYVRQALMIFGALIDAGYRQVVGPKK